MLRNISQVTRTFSINYKENYQIFQKTEQCKLSVEYKKKLRLNILNGRIRIKINTSWQTTAKV